ncbi:B3 domain-containing transcription factor VRN1-like [Gossypium arboreum]|uniref:B3 domain-containing transcription factor VRN1-like n=1 Tax=Gossypium arboreum TaxID=29729 RepID=UPI000819298E|nr:B3 domain-containing transcription factor VRN1-like [Gossypium arboreum]
MVSSPVKLEVQYSRYKRNDHFHVLIFDQSVSEIEYPHSSTEDNGDGHISVAVCGEDSGSASRKNKEKPDLPCPPPQKKMRTASKLDNSSSHVSLEDPSSRKSKLSATTDDGVIPARQSMRTKVLSCSQKLIVTEKARANQIASAYESNENPAFMVFMRPLSVCHGYPIGLCYELFDNAQMNTESKNLSAQLYGGWRTFVKDNRINIGDVCVFELIRQPEILMKVQVYPAAKNARKARKSLAPNRVASQLRTRILVNDTESDCQHSNSPI